jgi:hypothetical protein
MDQNMKSGGSEQTVKGTYPSQVFWLGDRVREGAQNDCRQKHQNGMLSVICNQCKSIMIEDDRNDDQLACELLFVCGMKLTDGKHEIFHFGKRLKIIRTTNEKITEDNCC